MTGPPQASSEGDDRSIVTISVLSADGEGVDELDVVAYPTPTPGLVAHRSPFDCTVWTVTHLPTGTGVSHRSWPTRQAALQLAERLGRLADWTADEDRLLSSAGVDVNRLRGAMRATADALADELDRDPARGVHPGPSDQDRGTGTGIAP